MILGIDPGWASLGCAVVDANGFLRQSFDGVPRDLGTFDYINHLWEKAHQITSPGAEPIKYTITDAYVERYVTYNGINTDPEKILMFIGALEFFLTQQGVRVHMVRAIDWKPKICKYLVRTKGFNNPYPKFDKKFSVLAATTLSGHEFKVDHEADAVCLAYLREVELFDLNRKGKK